MAKTKGVRYWTKRLDPVFSRFVRLRDAIEATGGIEEAVCITCKARKPVSSLHAGHWIARTKMATRWDERNVHAQCVSCNTWNNGEPQMYEDELRIKYGDVVVDELRAVMHTTRKWTPSELEELVTYYKGRVKEYETNIR